MLHSIAGLVMHEHVTHNDQNRLVSQSCQSSAEMGAMGTHAHVAHYSKALQAQAVACSRAAYCSHDSGQESWELHFASWHIHITMQYGLELSWHPSWQLQTFHKPGLSALESCWTRTLHDKPGGWSQYFIITLIEHAHQKFRANSKSPQQSRLLQRLHRLMQDHYAWYQKSQPALIRQAAAFT